MFCFVTFEHKYFRVSRVRHLTEKVEFYPTTNEPHILGSYERHFTPKILGKIDTVLLPTNFRGPLTS